MAGSETPATVPAPQPAPAEPAVPAATTPAPAAPSVGWTTSWGPFAMEFREDGQVGSWGVRFTGAASGHWLIQKILNIVSGEHCDGSAYPGETPLFPAPTRRYFEAWWVDEKGDVKVPKSLTTPPEAGEPFGYGHDLWNFNTLSKKETRGVQSRMGNLYQVPTLPEGFEFGKVAEAEKLPAMTDTPKDLGSPVAPERGADVEWDYKPKDPTVAPFQEIRTPV